MTKKIISALLSLLLISFSVYADGVSVSVIYDTETDSVSVSGDSNSDVSVTVLKNGIEPGDIGIENPPIYFRIAESENGRYSLNFGIDANADSGKYDIYVSSKDGKATASFIRINKNVDASVIDALNKASTLEEFSNILETNSSDFGIDTDREDYEKLKTASYKMMFSAKRKYKTSSEVYYDALTAFALSEVISSDDTVFALQNGADNLGINYLNDFKNDTRLSDAAKKKLTELLKNEDWENVFSGSESELKKLFCEKFAELKALSSAVCAQTGGELKKAVTEDFNDVFKELLLNEKYKEIKSKEEVFSLTIKKGFKDMKTFKTAFDYATETRYKEENKKSTGSGSGSSGSGGGLSSGSIEVPAVKDNVNTNPRTTPFTDTGNVLWAQKAIEKLYLKGILKGYEDDTFRPDGNITRAEFSKLITEGFLGDKKAPSGTETVFSDVLSSDWFSPFVKKAAAHGIIMGYDGLFNPQGNITREDACVMLYRAITHTEAAGTLVYTDKDIVSEYAAEAVLFLSSANIVRGRENNMFAPKDSITRAEAAVLISAALDYIDSLQN